MKKRTIVPVVLTIICCFAMLAVDGLWQPGYWIKSGVKIILFLGAPVICQLVFRDPTLQAVIRPNRKGILRAILMGLAVYAVILVGFFLLKSRVDFTSVLNNLPDGVSKSTFPFVALYISFINSLLEEFFFRGFAYLSLRDRCKGAALFSAVAFALYHTAMMLGWFPPMVFILALVGLTVGGLIFNYLDSRDGSIYTGWLVHMFANFAINTIGFLLFYEIV